MNRLRPAVQSVWTDPIDKQVAGGVLDADSSKHVESA